MAAVLADPKHVAAEQFLSMTKFIAAKFRSKRLSLRRKDASPPNNDPRPALLHSPLPLVLPEHQSHLSSLGWTTLTFPTTPSTHPLQSAAQDLFLAAQSFFDLPIADKTQWRHRALGTEEGWTLVPGEKEFITLRTLSYTPDVLKQPAKRYWDLMGAHLSSSLSRVSASVGLPTDEGKGLQGFVGPCARMGEREEDKTATMLRIFRYEGDVAKVVAEPHRDLGLLSCVVGDVPGLEVYNGEGGWFEVERWAKDADRREKRGGDAASGDTLASRATILAGRQLERYTNFRYPAGAHRVVAYGKQPSSPASRRKHTDAAPATEAAAKPTYRHSIVFVLRAHEPTPIYTSELETHITGKWKEPLPDGTTAGKLYEQVKGQHFNVNIGMEERERQRRKVRDMEGKGTGNEKGKMEAVGKGTG